METVRPYLPAVALGLALPFAAFVVGLASDFGEDVQADFYSAVAQIIPILFLALLIEISVRFSAIPKVGANLKRLREEEVAQETPETAETDSREDTEWLLPFLQRSLELQVTVVGFAVWAALGEVAALYALAADESTTFLLMLSVLSLVTMLYMLMWTFVRRFAF